MSQDSSETLYCYIHPNRETLLRCNKCERPICTECAVLTPTGYRCKECVKSQQKKFETAQWLDYPLSIAIAGIASFVGSYLSSFLGFFTILIAPVVGVIIAEIVRAITKKRRAKLLFQLVTLSTVLGSFPLLFIKLINLFLVLGAGNISGGIWSLLPLLWQGLYTFLVASTVYYRLSGIKIG